IQGMKPDSGLYCLNLAADLYMSIGDTHNYIGVKTNILRYYLGHEDTTHCRPVISELLVLTKNKNWYTAEIELYKLNAWYSKIIGDTVATTHWNWMADKSYIAYLSSINSAQINAFRTLYETRELKEQVAEMEINAILKQAELDRQTRRTRELAVY